MLHCQKGSRSSTAEQKLHTRPKQFFLETDSKGTELQVRWMTKKKPHNGTTEKTCIEFQVFLFKINLKYKSKNLFPSRNVIIFV